MSINDPYAPGAVRQSRMQILCNGRPIAGALDFSVQSHNYYESDLFNATFAFNADPAYGLAFWGDPAWDNANPLMLDIQASLNGGVTWTSLILAQCDHVSVHLDRGIAQVDGRDLTARLTDYKLDAKRSFINQTSSQIAASLAAEVGLQTDIVPTSTLVGTFDGTNYTITPSQYSRASTAWNLISSLAQQETYDAWISGATLHFKPIPAPGSDPFVVVFDKAVPFANATSISAERALSFSRDVTVEVKSYNSKQARPFSATSGPKNASTFTYTFPNLSKAECLEKAAQIRQQLSAHERLIAIQRPADLTLSSRDLVRLQGTGSTWDTTYRVDAITREMSFDGGFAQTVQGKSYPLAAAA